MEPSHNDSRVATEHDVHSIKPSAKHGIQNCIYLYFPITVLITCNEIILYFHLSSTRLLAP